VGADNNSPVSDAINAYFDSLGNQGDVTQERNDSEPETPSVLDNILNSFSPQMPSLAGCQGAGIPCRVMQLPFRARRGGGLATAYWYTVVDVNGDPVAGVTQVQEFLSPIYGDAPSEGTWSTTGDDPQLVNGTFVDNVGMVVGWNDFGGFEDVQSFSAQLNGVNYALTTQVIQQSVWLGGNNVYGGATVTKP
jgi:hypothetical protein